MKVTPAHKVPVNYFDSPNTTEIDAIDYLLIIPTAQLRNLRKVIRKMQAITGKSRTACMLAIVAQMKGF